MPALVGLNAGFQRRQMGAGGPQAFVGQGDPVPCLAPRRSRLFFGLPGRFGSCGILPNARRRRSRWPL